MPKHEQLMGQLHSTGLATQQNAFRAAGVETSYPNLTQLLRRRGNVDTHRAQMHELFRRMVFNIVIESTDNHEKNHVLLVNQAKQYELAPTFDVLPMVQSLG